jgi:hypothetical protein
MALGKEKEGGNYISFKPAIGRLTIKSDASDPEAKPRTYKDSKTNEDVTVYEQRYQYLSGKIVGLSIDTTGDYGSQMKLVVRDGDTDYTLPIPLNKGWGTKVAEVIPNVKLDEEVLFTAYNDFVADDGKERKAGVSVKQNKERVNSAFNYKQGDEWILAEGFPAYPSSDSIPDKTKNKAKYTKFWNDYYFSVEEFLIDWFTKNLTIEYTAPVKEVVEEDAEEIAF